MSTNSPSSDLIALFMPRHALNTHRQKSDSSPKPLATEHKALSTPLRQPPLCPSLSLYVTKRVAELHSSHISAEERSEIEDMYLAYTLCVIDWLRTSAAMSLPESHRMSELDVLRAAKEVGKAGIEVPETVREAWGESIRLRKMTVRYEKVRCEEWDVERKRRLEGLEAYVGLLELARSRVMGDEGKRKGKEKRSNQR